MRRLCMVPAKPLARAKARLAPAFSATDRRAIVLAMLGDVVAAARAGFQVWVICSDTDVADAAVAAGAVPVQDETPDAGLNPSLDTATNAAMREGFAGVLVLASDVPCATPEDVAALLVRGGVAIAPSSDGTGTNALWRSPPGVIPAAFGPSSRAAHERLAREAGVDPTIVRRPRLALDVDVPEDLVAALETGVGTLTRNAAERIGFPVPASRGGSERRYRSRGR